MGEEELPNRVDEPGVESLRRAATPPPSPDLGRRVSIPKVVVGIVTVLVLGVATSVLVKMSIESFSADGDRGEIMPADSDSPPVLIEHVTPLSNDDASGSFVLPERLDMSREELQEFSKNIASVTKEFEKWYAEQDAAAIDRAATSVSLRGNADETVRIADIEVIKECREPYNGTYFASGAQGTGRTVGVGFNLDLPKPIPHEMVQSEARGAYPLDNNFFSDRTIELAPDETLTLSLNVWTEAHACSFTFRLIVTTSSGSYWQEIDNQGEPFSITATARADVEEFSLSGYKAAYVSDYGQWSKIDPSTNW
ncbi:hypothetical protein GCM10027059_45710 [Myceligenerans halotolerans]